MPGPIDKLDLSILRELQENARITNVELSDKVGLSPSACSRRLEQLQSNGVISAYQAVISNKALGQTITAIIHITLSSQADDHLRQFEAAIEKCPHVVACFLMSGECDYIIRVNAADMPQFEQIHKMWLSTLPGVSRMQTSFAMREVINRANVDVSVIEQI